MGTQAVQRIAKVRDVEAISYEDLLVIQRDDGVPYPRIGAN
jgi:hypothetical protein